MYHPLTAMVFTLMCSYFAIEVREGPTHVQATPVLVTPIGRFRGATVSRAHWKKEW